MTVIKLLKKAHEDRCRWSLRILLFNWVSMCSKAMSQPQDKVERKSSLLDICMS